MKSQRRAAAIATRAVALLAAGGSAAAIAQERMAEEGAQTVAVQVSPDELEDAPGRETVAQCGACHSLDYIRMNSRFLDVAGWTAVVNKMINVYGAPIPKTDVEAIARYLAQHYGKPSPPPAASSR